MKQTPPKTDLLTQLLNKKMEAQKAGSILKPFQNFRAKKDRNHNGSAVGPSWGRRKGN